MHRLILLLLAFGSSASALAADLRPADFPSAPPPPTLSAEDQSPDAEPEVTIKREEAQTIEEYRAGGRLYMIKITPKYGKPYFLVDDRGDGKFARQEALDSGVRVPRWTIHRF